jgi:hypothetical protein
MTKTIQVARIELLLEKLFDSQREEWKDELPFEEFEKLRHDFVFHMTDWKDDLERLAALFNNPDRQAEENTSVLLLGFLHHVVPHLNAAARLLVGDIESPFSNAENDQKERSPRTPADGTQVKAGG